MASNFELIGIEAVVAGIASFERDATSVNRLLQQINNTTQSLAGGNAFSVLGNAAAGAFSLIVAGSAAAVTALVGVSAGAVEVAASFEQNILRASAVTGSSAANIQALGQAVISVGNNSRLGLTSIADGENTLARAGFTATDITNGLLDATTKFAEASGGKLGAAQAANLMSESIKAFGLTSNDASRVADTLTAAVNSSVIQYSDLSIILRQVAPIAASLNIPIEDLGAAIGVLGQAGISGSIAGSALKDVLVKLADPSKQAAAELKKFGITIQDGAGNILPFREIVQLMSKDLSDNAVASGKVTEAQREQALAVLFGTRGIEAGLALVRGGTQAFDQMANSIANTNVNRIADDMRNSLIPQLDRLRNIVQGLVIDFGTPLEQALTKSLIKVNDFLSSLDPRIPQLFGQALLTIFNGLNASTVKFDFTSLLGPGVGGVFSGLLDTILSVRSAIIDDIVPAFRVLADAIIGGTNPVVDFGGTLEQLSRTITTIGQDIASAIEFIAAFITVVRDFGLLIAPIENVTNGFIALYNAILTLPNTINGLVTTAFTGFLRIINTVETALSGMLVYFRDIGIALVAIGALLATVFVVNQISIATTAVISFGNEVVLTAVAIGNLVGVAFNLGLALAPLAAQVLIDAASLIYFGAVAVASAIEDIGLLIIALVRLGVSFAVQAVIIVTQGTAVAGSFLAQAAAAIAYAIAVNAMEIALGIAGAALAVFTVAVAGVDGAMVIFGAIVAGVGTVIAVFASGVIANAIGSLIGFAGVLISSVVPAVLSLSIAFATSLGTAAGLVARFVADAIISMATLAGTIAGTVARAVLDFALLGASALGTAAQVSLAFLSTIPEAVATSVTVVIATLAPFLLGLAAIIAVIVLVYEAWTNNWLGIQGVVQKAISFILDKINNLITEIEKIPFVKDALDKAGAAFTGLKDTATKAGADVQTSITNLVEQAKKDFPGMAAQVVGFAQSVVSSYAAIITATDAVAAANARLAASYRFIPSQEQTQTSIAQNYERQSGQAQQLANPPGAYSPPPFVPPGPPIEPASTGKTAAGIKSITLELERMLAVLPGNTKALADFLNQLNQITPGRGLQLADDLIKAKDTIIAIRDEYAKVLAIQQAQVSVQDDINKLTAQQNVISLQTEAETLGYKIQINQLDQQSLDIKQQELPIENAIADIDQQIAAVRATNYAVEAQSLENQLAQARVQQQMLPAEQAIATIERSITDSINERTGLLIQQQELQQGLASDTTQYQLDKVQASLKTAFNNKDYTQVVALEQQQYALEQTLAAQKDQLKLTQDQGKINSDNNAIITNAGKLQEQQYVDVLKPLGDQLLLLQQQGQTIDANKKIVELENSIVINALDQQKAALTALLDPLKQQQLAITQAKDAIQLQIDKITAQKDAEKLRLDAKLLEDKLELESLKTLSDAEQLRFQQVVFGFINAQVASGNFTEAEAANSIKVLGYWNNEIQKVQQLTLDFGSEKAAAQAVVDTIALIKDRTVTITIKYVTEGSPTGTFQYGGTVPGPIGQPQLIIAHGGEQFLGVGNSISPSFTQRAGIGNSAQQVNNYYNNYEVNASYKQQESPANIGLDLRALTAMTSR